VATRNEILQLIIRARDEGAQRTLDNLQKTIVGIGVGYLSWHGAKEVISWTIGAAIESERVWAGVANAVRNVGESSRVAIPILRHYADEIRKKYGIDDEEVGRLQKRLMEYGLSSAAAMQATMPIIDFAIAKDLDYSAAAALVGRANAGVTRGLGAFGIKIDESASKAEKLRLTLEGMTKAGLNAAETQANTLGGAINRLKTSFSELGEEIGEGGVSGGLKDDINLFTDVVQVTEGRIAYDKRFNAALEKWQTANAFQTSLFGKSTDEMSKDILDFVAAQLKLQQSNPIVTEETNKLIIKIREEAAATKESELNWLDFTERLREGKISGDEMAATVKILNKEMSGGWEETNKLIIKLREQAAALQENNANWLDYDARLRAGTVSVLEMAAAEEILNKEFAENFIPQERDVSTQLAAISKKVVESQKSTNKQLLALDRQLALARDKSGTAAGKVIVDALYDARPGVEREATLMEECLSSALAAGGNAAADQIIAAMHGARLNLASIFSAMADDFVKFFIKKAVEAITGDILTVLTTLFDNPTNDAMAARQGYDFGRHFARGFAKAMVPGGANFSPALAATGGARTTALSIHFHGPVTDQAFVRKTIVPAIERAASEGTSQIAMKKGNLTGWPI